MKVLFLNSAQASSKNLAQGTALFRLSQPLSFPDRNTRTEITCHEFSFTNFFINVSDQLNNNVIYYSNDTATPNKYTITIPNGCYDVDSLNTVLSVQQQATVNKVIFKLQGNYSTGICYLLFLDTPGYYVTFPADSPVTGFTAGSYPASKSNTANQVIYASAPAQFNNMQQINVTCNLTSDSILNRNQSCTIHVSTPTVGVGSTQTDKPINLLWMWAPSLKAPTTDISISLYDQDGKPLYLTENFSLTLLIREVIL